MLATGGPVAADDLASQDIATSQAGGTAAGSSAKPKSGTNSKGSSKDKPAGSAKPDQGKRAEESEQSSRQERPALSNEVRKAAQGGATRPAPANPAPASSNGISGSAYTGSYYRSAYEGFRRCVVHRESRGDYTITNPRSGASGAYQFMLTTSNEVARRMGHPELVGRPAATWPRALQDQAFYTLYDHGRGAGHWGGSCG